jgi:hypothetical protein
MRNLPVVQNHLLDGWRAACVGFGRVMDPRGNSWSLIAKLRCADY